MQPIWEMLHNELTEIYTIHAVMSLKITEDVERPLRSSIQNDNEYHAIKSVCILDRIWEWSFDILDLDIY